jgi:hypothetical protein
VITQSSDRDVANRSLELDERVRSVVWVRGASLAAGTEVSIVADSALVTVSLDERLSAVARVAKWPVTVYAMVASLVDEGTGQRCMIVKRFIDRHKSVTGVDEAGVGNASRAVIPVRAVETLVANTENGLVTSITDSIVTDVAARSKESLSNAIKVNILNSWKEGMLRVVAMFH